MITENNWAVNKLLAYQDWEHVQNFKVAMSLRTWKEAVG